MIPALLAASVVAAVSPLTQSADPREGVVPLPCAEGWSASLVLDIGDVGIWCTRAFDLFPQYGTPEVVGLDDRGRCWMMVHYSGKWTPLQTLQEGEWLGAAAHGDVDPRAPGAELYVGGKKGNLYQVRTYPFGATDHRLVARFPGCELHTVIAGDLDPRTAGPELLVFTRPGALHRVTPSGPDGEWESTLLQELPGRVRDAVALPLRAGDPAPRIATVTRAGTVSLLQLAPEGARWEVVHAAPVGKGRLALAPPRAGAGVVLYSTQDDGVVLRHEERAQGWRTEVVYRGAPGPRGLRAGRFDADSSLEQLVVFGYSQDVELLTRRDGAWTAETLFTDRGAGHWLDLVEIDSRNATPEIIGSGYGGRIFLLSRPPGYGCDDGAATRRPQPAAGAGAGATADPSPPSAGGAGSAAARRDGGLAALRAAFVAGASGTQRVDPLRYNGGFQAKTALFETLVRRTDDGRIAPGLASAWRVADDGRTCTLTLREGATWHDGAPVTAEQVATHFRRVALLPEHAWLRGLARVAGIDTPTPREVRFVLREPWDLLSDLCAVNPCSVRGPATLDGAGEFVRPVGTGPWRHLEERDGGRVLALEAADGSGRRLSLATFPLQPVLGVPTNAAFDAFLAGDLDVLADGWLELVPRSALPDRFGAGTATSAPGTSVWYLGFTLEGPTASRALRRRIASALDRAALVAEVEHGQADPSEGWAAQGVTSWPAPATPPPLDERERAEPLPAAPLRFVASDNDREARLARAVAAQLAAAGVAVAVDVLAPADLSARVAARAFDLRLERTWGLPYDPDLSLQARFLPPTEAPSAAERRDLGVDPALRELVERLARTTREADRAAITTAIQRRIEAEASIVPLYAPRRLALARGAAPLPRLTGDLYRIGW